MEVRTVFDGTPVGGVEAPGQGMSRWDGGAKAPFAAAILASFDSI